MRIINLFYILFPFLFYGQTSTSIDFIWKPAEANSQRFEKAVMLIPVRFHPDTTTYFLQFDTGSTHSLLYSRRLSGSNLSKGVLPTSIGKIRFKENRSVKATGQKNAPVGTLGADFLEDRIVRINYTDQTITFNAPYNSKEFHIQPLALINGRPIFTVNIDGKSERLLYDTGSSLFGLWTTKRNWNRLRNKDNAARSFPISSWGKINDGFYSTVDSSIPLTLQGIDNSESLYVWYVANKNFRRFFRQYNLYGILGNQSFTDKEIILDFKDQVFGIKIDRNSGDGK